VEVSVVRLYDIFVDVLKIDIEGADTWALMGAERLLRNKQVGRIFYEENRPRMAELGIHSGEAKAFLESHGYQVEKIDGDSISELWEFEAFTK
jgi:hypothetical protein